METKTFEALGIDVIVIPDKRNELRWLNDGRRERSVNLDFAVFQCQVRLERKDIIIRHSMAKLTCSGNYSFGACLLYYQK